MSEDRDLATGVLCCFVWLVLMIFWSFLAACLIDALWPMPIVGVAFVIVSTFVTMAVVSDWLRQKIEEVVPSKKKGGGDGSS